LRVFDIRRGELKRVLLMQITIFLLISTLLIIKPTINSLFLSVVGIKKLPLAFILVAVIAGIITSFYSKLLNRITLNKIIQFTLLFSVIVITLFSILLKLNLIDKWVLYVFYAWAAVFAVLATSQFWILANIIFNAREAKRLFSLIGGAAIGGGIFGGYLTSLLAPIIGTENLLFVAVLFLIVCIPLTRAIWNSNEALSKSVFKRKQRMGKISERPYRLILNSKHLKYLALITAISVLVAKLVDYQFSAISSQRITNEDDLTAFFGFWFSTINIISLLIQLFLTRKVVGVYGVGISLFFLPAGILIGAMAIVVSPGLWSAIFIKASDGSLKQSVNKSAIELLALPIPSETKKQAKTFIDVFVDSFATGMSGILLITFINGLHLDVRYVSILIILLIAVWLYFVIKVRAEYISLFKKKLNLNKTPLKVKGALLDLNNDSVYGGLKKVLENGSESQIIYVLKNTADFEHEKLLVSIKKLLTHTSTAVVLEAIRKLRSYKSENLSPEVLHFVESINQDIKVAAIEYLIEHAEVDRIETIKKYLFSNDDSISYAALLAYANETKDNPDLRERVGFSQIIETKLEELKSSELNEKTKLLKCTLLKVIGTTNLHEFYYCISESLKDKDPLIVKTAVYSAGLTLDIKFLDELLEFLAIDDMKESAVHAISQFGFKIISYLRVEASATKNRIEIVRGIPQILEAIGTQYGVDFLFELLDYNDNVVRNQSIEALAKLKTRFPHLIFYNKAIIHNIFDEANLFMNTLSALYVQQESISQPSNITDEAIEARKSLIKILERRLDNNLEHIFKFLGLKYPPEDIHTIYSEIKSDKAEMRINAIEFLDNLLDTNLKKIIIPILETSISETITKEVLNELKIKIIGQTECFQMLLESKDVKVKMAVFYLLIALKDRQYLPLASNYVNHPDKKVSSFALKSVRAMTQGDD